MQRATWPGLMRTVLQPDRRLLPLLVVLLAITYVSGQDLEDATVDEACRAQSDVNTSVATLHLAFVVTGDADTTLVDAALRSLLYYRSCPVHFHLVQDAVTSPIDWNWLGWYENVRHSTYLTQYDPQSTLKPSTFETWGTGTTPDGEEYAWSRAVIPSRFAKLSLDAILPSGIEDVLFVDNDVVFLDDVCKAHAVFANMSHTAVFGMSPQMSDLYTHVQAPFAFPVNHDDRWRQQPGINSGVVFWKLERARDICWSPSYDAPRPNHCLRRWDWLHYLEEGISHYSFGLLDQDVFNYVGWLHPEFVQVVPLRWNVQLVKYICKPNTARPEMNLADNINADILILHGNARHFKINAWFSRHIWFLFAHPTVQQYGDARSHHKGTSAICSARPHVQDDIREHLSHCSWQA